MDFLTFCEFIKFDDTVKKFKLCQNHIISARILFVVVITYCFWYEMNIILRVKLYG